MPKGRRTSTQVGRCSESVSAMVPSRSKRRALYKPLAPVEDHVQGAGDDQERPHVEQEKEMPTLPPLSQRARLVLGHPADQGNRAQPPHPVEGEVPREVAWGGIDRRPREGQRDEGRQRERDDEQSPVHPAPPPPGEPAGDDLLNAVLHEHHGSSPRPKESSVRVLVLGRLYP